MEQIVEQLIELNKRDVLDIVGIFLPIRKGKFIKMI